MDKIILKNNPKFKAIYQDYDWLYQKIIIEGLNKEAIARLCGASKRVIEKWVNEKYKLNQKTRQQIQTINKKQEDIIIGSLLGDGHIDKRKTQPLFIVSHAENQKDYLYWKYNILKNLCNKEPSIISSKIKYFNDKPYICQPSYRMTTRIIDELKFYRNLSSKDLINMINETSFSVFMLDDGHRSNKKIWGVCVASYPEEEKLEMIDVFKEKFEIVGYLCKDTRYMNFRVPCSKIIDEIILRNIPNDLDIIQYKIIKKMGVMPKC